MKIYCLPLELIAFAIHPGDTQSTTTVCVDVGKYCLYITSQSNFDFKGVTPEQVRGIIDFLTMAASEYRKKSWDLEKCCKLFWDNYCALSRKIGDTTPLKTRTEVKRIYDNLYIELWKKFLMQDYSAVTLQKLKSMIFTIAVINDRDISYKKAIDKTGVHGESRLIRFFFIRDYPSIHLNKTGKFFYMVPGLSISNEIKDNARTWFREKIRSESYAMGSSQGTCQGCCNCLDEFSIAHGDLGNVPKQWLDPITLCGFQGTTAIKKMDGVHAIFVAFKYLTIPPDDEDEESISEEGK